MDQSQQLQQLSITELKALVYDELAKIESFQKQITQCQIKIKAINEEINIKKLTEV